MILKRRSTIKNAQKSLFRVPVTMKMEIYDDVAVYQNQNIAGYTRLLGKKKKPISNNIQITFFKKIHFSHDIRSYIRIFIAYRFLYNSGPKSEVFLTYCNKSNQLLKLYITDILKSYNKLQ